MYMIAEVSQYVAVASFAEAWIEILYPYRNVAGHIVASFAEAWIEISVIISRHLRLRSPPSRRRGLKSAGLHWYSSPYWSPPSRRHGLKYVRGRSLSRDIPRRLLHGGVD